MRKIMIVDDEQDLREMINLIMQKEGFETKLAEDGIDFLKKIDSFQPDLITLDVLMPGLTTIEILDKLKEKKSDPKIILLTIVRFSDKEKEKLFEMGNIVDYIIKPFDIDELIDRVYKHVTSERDVALSLK